MRGGEEKDSKRKKRKELLLMKVVFVTWLYMKRHKGLFIGTKVRKRKSQRLKAKNIKAHQEVQFGEVVGNV